MPLPDYLASLADLEAYPETLIADITGEYDTDIGAVNASVDALNLTIATQAATIEALQGTNAMLIASIGIADTPPAEEKTDAETEDERGENITFDDLLESE